MRLWETPEYEHAIHELPTPLAKPIARIHTAFDDPENGHVLGFLVGLDAFEAILKWLAFLGIADIYQKIEDSHPFVSREPMEKVYRAVHCVLEPRQVLGKWVDCLREIYSSYSRTPDLFFVPEIVPLLDRDESPLLKGIGALLALRNDYTHECSRLPSESVARENWKAMEPWLALTLKSLEPLHGYPLVQFYRGFFPTESFRQDLPEYEAETCYLLRGFHYEEAKDLKSKGSVRFRFPAGRAVLPNALYLFDAGFARHLRLHPFVLFSHLGEATSRTKTFFFNEITEGMKEIKYLGYVGDKEASLKRSEEEDDGDSAIAGPLWQYFSELKYVVSRGDPAELARIPGFGRRSPVLNFKNTIEFHDRYFVGRENLFAHVEAYLNGPGGGIWIFAEAGLGKTAFMAELAKRREKDVLHYFVSNASRTYEARVFLLHVCTLLARRFGLDFSCSGSESNEDLTKAFHALLGKASDALQASPGEKIVILVDALDESERYVVRREDSIVRCLPEKLPPGVFLILSSRPNVDLGHLAQLRIQMEPLNRDEVRGILRKEGWSDQDAETLYEKTGGSPVYIHFLVSDIRAKRVRPEKARHLPADVQGYYREIWNRWKKEVREGEEADPGKAATEEKLRKAASARRKMEMLGYLGAAREPLSLEDLGVLMNRMDPQDLRALLAPQELGRMLIGSQSFTLFHDTLREFVVGITGAQDGRPHAEGLCFHEGLLRWSADWRDSPYLRKHLPYHLLHARRYRELVQLLEDGSTGSYLRLRERTGAAPGEVASCLELGMEAARELDALDSIFHLSLLRLATRHAAKTGAAPGTGAVLVSLGRVEDARRLAASTGDPEVKARLVEEAFAAAARRDFGEACEGFGALLREIWASVRRGGDSRGVADFIARVDFLSKESIASLREYLPGLEAGSWVGGLTKGLMKYPVKAAALVLECPAGDAEALSGEKDTVRGLAARLLPVDEESSWRLLARIMDKGGSSGFFFNRDIVLDCIPFAKRDLARMLGILESWRPRASSIGIMDPWVSVDFTHAVVRLGCAFGQAALESWVGRQAPETKCVALAFLANASGEAKEFAAAESFARSNWAGLDLTAMLACLCLLGGTEGRVSRDNVDSWRKRTLATLEMMEAAHLLGGMDKRMRRMLKDALPKMGPVLRELRETTGDDEAAIHLALALSSPARKWLTDARFLERAQRGQTEEGTAPEDRLLTDAAKECLDAFSDADRDQAAKIVIPALVGMVRGEDVSSRMRPFAPSRNAVDAASLIVLAPPLGFEDLRKIADSLTTEDGDPELLPKLASVYLQATRWTDPGSALRLWREWNGELARLHPAQAPSASPESPQSQAKIDGAWIPGLLLLCGDMPAAIEAAEETGADSRFEQMLPWEDPAVWAPRLLDRIFETRGAPPKDLFPALPGELPDPYMEALVADRAWDHGLCRRLKECGTAFPSWAADDFARLASVALEHGEMALFRTLAARVSDESVRAETLMRWIGKTADADLARAERMWAALRRHTAGERTAFLASIRERLDREFRGCLQSREPDPDRLSRLAATVPANYVSTRALLAGLMLRTGWPRESVEPLIVAETEREFREIRTSLSDVPCPEWAILRLRQCAERFLSAAEEKDTEYLLGLGSMVLWAGWGSPAGRHLAQAWSSQMENALSQPRLSAPVKARLTLSMALCTAAADGDWGPWRASITGTPRDHAGSVVHMLQDANPRLARRAVEDLPDPAWRQEEAARAAVGLLIEAPGEFMDAVSGIPAIRVLSALEGAASDLSARSLTAVAEWIRRGMPAGQCLEFENWYSWPHHLLCRLFDHDAGAALRLLGSAKTCLGLLEHLLSTDLRARLLHHLPALVDRWIRETQDAMLAKGPRESLGPVEALLEFSLLMEKPEEAQVRETALGFVENSLRKIWSTRPDDDSRLMFQHGFCRALGRLAPADPVRTLELIRALRVESSINFEELFSSFPESAYPLLLSALPSLNGLKHFAAALKGSSDAIASRPVPEALAFARSSRMDLKDLAPHLVRRHPEDDALFAELVALTQDDSERFYLWVQRARGAAEKDLEKAPVYSRSAVDVLSGASAVRERGALDYFKLVFRDESHVNAISIDEGSPFAILTGIAPGPVLEFLERQDWGEVKCSNSFEPERVLPKALPWMLKISPGFVLRNLENWMVSPWWQNVEEKTIEEASLKMEPEVATKIVCHCRDAALRDRLIPKILDRAEDASEARECLEVILVDSIQGSPDDAAWAIAKVLAHAGKAGLDPVDLMIAFASRLEAVSRSAGESPFGSAEELVEALDRIATGKEEEPRGASAEMQPREPTDEELAAILPDDQRRALRDLEMALDALRRAGQESPFLEGQRKIFLSQARRLWEEKRAAAPS